jgi:pilus assembly protein Flp/PilA
MMQSVIRSVRRFLESEDGPTAVEYAVMLMLMILSMITAIQLVGNWASGSWQDSSDKLDQAMSN